MRICKKESELYEKKVECRWEECNEMMCEAVRIFKNAHLKGEKIFSLVIIKNAPTEIVVNLNDVKTKGIYNGLWTQKQYSQSEKIIMANVIAHLEKTAKEAGIEKIILGKRKDENNSETN